MNEAKRNIAKERIDRSTTFKQMDQLQRILDKYYLDGVIGLIPLGIGDFVTALFALIYIRFAIVKVNSIALTLAIANNILRDVLLGLIPFYLGNVLDFFYRSNRENMMMIRGFVDGDKEIIRNVNKRATQSAVGIFIFLALIAGMLYVLITATKYIIGFNSLWS